MKILTALRLAASGLATQKVRLDVSAMNLANAHVTRTLEGGPYRAKNVVVAATPLPQDFAEKLDEALATKLSRAQVIAVIDDQSPFKEVYDPGHPDADERGYVKYPNVDVMSEMVELLEASRAYEANLSVVNITKSLALKTLELLR
jgi:flagellar basal-body rod protein FlgC